VYGDLVLLGSSMVESEGAMFGCTLDNTGALLLKLGAVWGNVPVGQAVVCVKYGLRSSVEQHKAGRCVRAIPACCLGPVSLSCLDAPPCLHQGRP
jgi:hypothetical protein